MIESFGFKYVLELVQGFGLPGIVFVIWYFSMRSHEKTLNAYREDMSRVLGEYKQDVRAVQQMYENNIVLVKNYERLSSDLKDVVTLNTQMFQKLCDLVVSNQYCPMVRLEKQAPGAVK